jgi:uncharacterized delta-60 repeat protein
MDRGRCLVLYPDGRILAAGHEVLSTQVACPIIRLMPDGSVDDHGRLISSFLSERFPAGSLELVSSMGVQPDGRLVVAGSILNSQATQIDVALSRYLPNGAMDMAFGVQGCLTFDVQNNDAGESMAIQPDGKIVVAGYTGSPNTQFLVTRFTSQGVADPTFGGSGFVTRDFATGADYAHAVAIAPDGKIVVAGLATNGAGAPCIGVARFHSNGVPDETLAGTGCLMYLIPGATGLSVEALLVQPDRKIIVGGSANGNFAVARFEESGILDTSFGVGGAGYTLTDMGGQDAIHALAVDSFGRFYAAGGGGANGDFALAQYQSNGTLDCPALRPELLLVGWQGIRRLGRYARERLVDRRARQPGRSRRICQRTARLGSVRVEFDNADGAELDLFPGLDRVWRGWLGRTGRTCRRQIPLQ